jgi:pheromone shutdown protein TraB
MPCNTAPHLKRLQSTTTLLWEPTTLHTGKSCLIKVLLFSTSTATVVIIIFLIQNVYTKICNPKFIIWITIWGSIPLTYAEQHMWLRVTATETCSNRNGNTGLWCNC